MPDDRKPTRVVIMGAAGRDFHNFNMVYRNNPDFQVVAFTAAQIPDISERRYPPALSGKNYPDGIAIHDEAELPALCRDEAIDQVIFAYSDVEHTTVMHKASIALAAGADFKLLGPKSTMIRANVPVIAICAVRTGCGKSQTTRWISKLLKEQGLRVGVIRHPMPYGDLEQQAVQRFAAKADLDKANCTIEEREEYEPHLAMGNIVYAGVDYQRIVELAQAESDILLWDGGNNDFSFLHPDLHIVLVDALRPGHETTHHPGEAVLRMADIVLVAKSNSAADADVRQVIETASNINVTATISRGASPVTLDQPELVRGKRVLIVEDGPTITHGGMPYGAGYIAATKIDIAEIIDPRITAVKEISDVYNSYPHIGPILPAMGYYPEQLKALAKTINTSGADIVVSGTPCDLGALVKIDKPIVRARYEFAEVGEPKLSDLIKTFLGEKKLTTT